MLGGLAASRRNQRRAARVSLLTAPSHLDMPEWASRASQPARRICRSGLGSNYRLVLPSSLVDIRACVGGIGQFAAREPRWRRVGSSACRAQPTIRDSRASGPGRDRKERGGESARALTFEKLAASIIEPLPTLSIGATAAGRGAVAVALAQLRLDDNDGRRAFRGRAGSLVSAQVVRSWQCGGMARCGSCRQRADRHGTQQPLSIVLRET